MPSNARNLANLLGAGESTISAEKLGSDVAPGTEDYSSIDSLGAGTIVGETAFVEGSNRLYIWNGSGWYNIALINTTPTWDSGGQPALSYVLDGDSPQDATVITLAASDPEGLPISYNYITSGQMDSIATISQDSSVFTITPKTSVQAPDGGTGSITFRATDGINILPQVSSFTLTFSSIVENSKYTTLLATATGTSDNNNITDASTNNHSITVNGDTHAGTFSPYRSGGYSAYMDGGDRYNLSSSADWNLGANWTIEGWFYPTAQPTETCRIFMFGANGGSAAMGIGLNSDMTWHGGGAFPNGAMFNNGATGYLNQWQHVAWVRDGSSNTGTVYVNGVASAGSYSGPAVQAAGNVDLKIGFDTVSTVAYQYRGYFADIRITKSAVYTSNFTPPTERLTSSDVLSDTKLLAFNKPYLKDQSAGNHNIYISDGNPRFAALALYDYNEYAAADHSGSVYFDGSGDKLTIGGSSSDFNFGTNSFTIESWVYSQVAAVGPIFNTHRAGTGSGYYLALLANGGINWGNYVDGTGDITTAAGAFTQNTWNHISLNRDASSSNSLKIYVNGILKYTGTSATDYNTFDYGPFVGGYDPGGAQYYFTGYISDLVVVNGSVLRTGGSSIGDVAFTPAATPIVTPSNTKLHIKGTDASIIDKSQNRNLKITSNITSTTQTKFANTRSIYFDGSTSVNLNETLIFPTTNTPFTGELWFYPTNIAGAGRLIGQADVANSGRLSLNLETDGRIRLYWNGANNLYSTNSISDNQWHHIAFVRKNNGYLAVYVNGTETELAQDNNNRSIDSSLTRIGSQGPSYFPSYIQGYIQDVRLTNGLARYTANFTPPTAPLEG